ncbi:hypothetical protein Acid345_0605 [Candidatus Koribacter versatilis Ellin345]|uniref:Uncharacterized protein n=1 Tax=Koribacter versatilis (strain Ellin345) TaxID=204669 RepID=Q1IU40_KORVE|nr:hypothetical protein [Candidatus Koribacter versatilis]ABF39610.1 hypothetical protein Acid345_0605 [Candidatus Koribacter versatilis Ellin345]
MSSPIILTVNWSATSGYSLTPPNPDINNGGTARFTSPNKPATIHFTPTNTPFGASKMVPMGGSVDVPVGAAEYQVQYSIAAVQATTGVAATAGTSTVRLGVSSGTIKVGSG